MSILKDNHKFVEKAVKNTSYTFAVLLLVFGLLATYWPSTLTTASLDDGNSAEVAVDSVEGGEPTTSTEDNTATTVSELVKSLDVPSATAATPIVVEQTRINQSSTPTREEPKTTEPQEPVQPTTPTTEQPKPQPTIPEESAGEEPIVSVLGIITVKDEECPVDASLLEICIPFTEE